MQKTIAAFFILLLAGCASLSTFEKPRVNLVNLQLEKANVLSQTFLLTLRIDNPNNYGFRIDGVDVDIALNGKTLAQGLSNQAIQVPRYGSIELNMTATTHLLGLLQQILVLGTRQPIDYRVSGHLNAVRGFAGSVKVPFSEQGELDFWNFVGDRAVTQPLGNDRPPQDSP